MLHTECRSYLNFVPAILPLIFITELQASWAWKISVWFWTVRNFESSKLIIKISSPAQFVSKYSDNFEPFWFQPGDGDLLSQDGPISLVLLKLGDELLIQFSQQIRKYSSIKMPYAQLYLSLTHQRFILPYR